MGKLGVFLFVLCLGIGLYNLNSVLSFVTLPAVIVGFIDVPLRIVGAILIVVGGAMMIKLGKKRLPYAQGGPAVYPRR